MARSGLPISPKRGETEALVKHSPGAQAHSEPESYHGIIEHLLSHCLTTTSTGLYNYR